jgi:hypothetical protein
VRADKETLRQRAGKLKRHERTKPATEARKRKRDEQRNGQRDVGRGDECGDVRNDQRDDERYTATGPQISERNDLHVINDAEWRRRLKSWVEMEVWRENWGGGPPEPGDAAGPDCAISAAVLNEWHNGLIDFSKIEYRGPEQAE